MNRTLKDDDLKPSVKVIVALQVLNYGFNRFYIEESDNLDTFINTAILGVFTYTCAGDYEPMKKIGFALIIIGMVGTTIAYQNLKERIEKLERQINKENDIIKQYKISEVNAHENINDSRLSNIRKEK